MISAKQIGLLRVAVKQLALPEDAYRAILRVHGGVESARDLDPPAFDRVVTKLNDLGFRSTWRRRTFGGRERAGMASPSQVSLIRHLWREWSGADELPPLDAWLERSFGVSSLRFVSAATAHKAITALRRMVARRSKEMGAHHGT